MSAQRITPATLRRMSRQDAVLCNRVFAPRAPISIGQDFTLHPRPDLPASLEQPVRVDLTVDNAPLALICPAGLIQAALTALQLTNAPQADTLPLLLALIFDPWLGQLENLFGGQIGVEAVMRDPAPPQGHERVLTLAAYGRDWPVLLSAPVSVLDKLFGAWPVTPQTVDDVPLPVAVRLGTTRLTIGQLRSLQPGDAVLFEHAPAGSALGTLVIGGRLRAEVKWNGRHWHLTETPTNRTMTPDSALPVPQAGAADDVPVTLCFETDTQYLSVSELRALTAGSAIALPAPQQSPLRLLIENQPIGTGQPINMDRRPGVCILRITHS